MTTLILAGLEAIAKISGAMADAQTKKITPADALARMNGASDALKAVHLTDEKIDAERREKFGEEDGE